MWRHRCYRRMGRTLRWCCTVIGDLYHIRFRDQFSIMRLLFCNRWWPLRWLISMKNWRIATSAWLTFATLCTFSTILTSGLSFSAALTLPLAPFSCASVAIFPLSFHHTSYSLVLLQQQIVVFLWTWFCQWYRQYLLYFSFLFHVHLYEILTCFGWGSEGVNFLAFFELKSFFDDTISCCLKQHTSLLNKPLFSRQISSAALFIRFWYSESGRVVSCKSEILS